MKLRRCLLGRLGVSALAVAALLVSLGLVQVSTAPRAAAAPVPGLGTPGGVSVQQQPNGDYVLSMTTQVSDGQAASRYLSGLPHQPNGSIDLNKAISNALANVRKLPSASDASNLHELDWSNVAGLTLSDVGANAVGAASVTLTAVAPAAGLQSAGYTGRNVAVTLTKIGLFLLSGFIGFNCEVYTGTVATVLCISLGGAVFGALTTYFVALIDHRAFDSRFWTDLATNAFTGGIGGATLGFAFARILGPGGITWYRDSVSALAGAIGTFFAYIGSKFVAGAGITATAVATFMRRAATLLSLSIGDAASGAGKPLTTSYNVDIMPFGDGWTIGEGAPLAGGGYRAVFQQALTDQGQAHTMIGAYTSGSMPQAAESGFSGAHMADLSVRARQISDVFTPSVVLYNGGTQDFLDNQDPSNYWNDWRDSINYFLQDGDTVLVSSLVPSGSVQRRAEMARVNAVMQQNVNRWNEAGFHVAWVDATAINDGDLANGDAVHPGVTGYAKLATAYLGGLFQAVAAGWVPEVYGLGSGDQLPLPYLPGCPPFSHTIDCPIFGGSPHWEFPAGRAAKIMVVGDSITNGFQGDYSWRYRLWQWTQAQQLNVDYVGPFKGTDLPGAPGAPTPPPVATDPSHLPSAPTGGGITPANDDPALFSGGYANGLTFDSDHYSAWGRQLTQDTSTIQRVMTNAGTPDVLVVELGFNDLGWLDASGNGLVTTMKNFIDQARAANPDVAVVLGNVPHRTQLDDDNLAGRTSDYNAALAKAVPGWSAENGGRSPVVLADVDSVYGCDPTKTVCSSAYDGLHPNNLGEFRIANAFQTALHRGLGLGTSVPAVPAASAVPQRVVSDVDPTTITYIGTGQGVTATWAPVYGAHGYDVQWRDVTTGQGWQDSSSSTARWDKSWQFLSPVVPEHTYAIQVRATDGTAPDGSVMHSPDWTSTSGVAHPQTAAGPTITKAVPTATGVDVAWAKPTGTYTGSIKEYALAVYDQDTPTIPSQVFGVSGYSAHVDGLKPGDHYLVYMDTWNAAGEGLPTAAPLVTVNGGQPPPPAHLTATITNPTTVGLSWNTSAGASGYQVYSRDLTDPASTLKPFGGVVSDTSTVISFFYPIPGLWNFQFCVSALNGTLGSAPAASCVTPPRPAGS